MRSVHVLLVCLLVTTAAGPAVADSLAQDSGAGPTEITDCGPITEPGIYVLADDLRTDASSCIRIEADDVILDGDGHVVDGGTPGTGVRQFVDETFRGQSSPDDDRWRRAGVLATDDENVTVRNVETTGWLVGISFANVRGGVAETVTARENGFGVVHAGGTDGSVVDATTASNDGSGVFLLGVGGATVRNVVANSNGVAGVYLVGSNGATVANATAAENNQVGIYLRGADAVSIRNAAADANAVGIVLENASDATVTNSTANLNRRTGVVAFASDRSRLVDSIASGNDFAGVYVIETEAFAVRDGRASQNAIGVVYENATNGTISGGTFAENGRTGVTLFNTTETAVTGANASRNDYHGVFVVNASGNAVTGSNASYNGLTGVYLQNATGNEITNNTLLANAIAGVFRQEAPENRVADNLDGATPFPSTDEEIGREGGIAHDDDIAIDQSDGLNDTELREYVYRVIARAEYVRGLEYNQTVDVEVITRSENRRRTRAQPPDPGSTAAWRDQVWEAAFLIGEDTNASEELEEFRGERVLGYYLSGANKMVVVTPGEGGEVDSVTLVHEFVHALQDMHLNLSETGQGVRTEDAQRARNGLVEGDASYVEEQFELLCGSIWNCVASNSTSPRSAEIPDVNLGVRRIVGQPYVDGPGYVDNLRQQGGWQAVNDAYDDVPNSTEQIIHPEKADEEPAPIQFENRPQDGWQRFNGTDLPFEGENGTNTLGEAAIYTMFWYQATEFDIPVIDADTHFVPEGGAFDRLNYTSTPSEGWGNDVLVPYRKGDQGAYVWATRWDTERDAMEFHRAYVQMLRGHDAERVGPRTWVIPDGPFEDAFHVVRRGKRVIITNAPEVGDLEDVRPGIEVQGSGGNATVTNSAENSSWVSGTVQASG